MVNVEDAALVPDTARLGSEKQRLATAGLLETVNAIVPV